MKVLLCQDVEKLGWLGDIVEVNEGFGRNYLLPQRLAIAATDANVKALAEEKARRAEKRTLEQKRFEAAIKAVDGAQVIISAKTNEQGHLFGSVAAHDIAENLRGQGFEVNDDVVRLPEHIKEIGTYDVTLKYATDATASVKVVVVSQDETVEASEQNS
ncbi:MAG: 50S ribosomal protein L9 [Sedimentisphaerales bacterium]|nr:50S ribosomal protein L9 [Sedimentisphaerales bacterium]